jgi:hypothetical protein
MSNMLYLPYTIILLYMFQFSVYSQSSLLPEGYDWKLNPENEHYYAYVDDTMNWKKAHDLSRSIGAYLVTITSEQENLWIYYNFSKHSYWTGLHDSNQEGYWEWITGEDVTYRNWASGEPNNSSGNEDYAIFKTDGMWNDYQSHNELHSIFEIGDYILPTPIPVTPTPTPTPNLYGLPPGQLEYQEENGNFYFLPSIKLNWQKANEYALSLGGHLATINSSYEQIWIQQVFPAKNGDYRYIGLSYLHGEWIWITEEPLTYQNLTTINDHPLYGGVYAFMHNIGIWHWDSGLGQRQFIIEFEKEIPTDTTVPTPTPIYTPLPLPEVSWYFPLEVETEIERISGGLMEPPYPGGDVYFGEIPSGEDGLGAMFILAPGQVELFKFPTLELGPYPVFVRASVFASAGGASIGLAALDGQLDGSIATNIPADSSIYKDRYHWIYLLYKAPGNSIVPIFQVSNLNANQPIVIYLDTLEVYVLDGEKGVPCELMID